MSQGTVSKGILEVGCRDSWKWRWRKIGPILDAALSQNPRHGTAMTWEQSLLSYSVTHIPEFSSGSSVCWTLQAGSPGPSWEVGRGDLEHALGKCGVLEGGLGPCEGVVVSELWLPHPGTGRQGAMRSPVRPLVVISCGLRVLGVLQGALQGATLATHFLLQGKKWEPGQAPSARAHMSVCRAGLARALSTQPPRTQALGAKLCFPAWLPQDVKVLLVRLHCVPHPSLQIYTQEMRC